MANPDEYLPKSMQPIADLRQTAAHYSYAHRLLQVSKHAISKEDEANYIRPSSDDFTVERAEQLVSGILRWAFASSYEGLLYQASLESSRNLLGRVATVTSNLIGLDIGTVQAVISELGQHETSCQELYKESRGSGDIGDSALFEDGRIAQYAIQMLRFLVDPSDEEVTGVLLSGYVDDGWGAVFDQPDNS